MVDSALKSMALKYACLLLILLLLGCQSSLNKIGQEHAKEVLKWQELARYAGNELKYLGLTVTTGVQINQSAGQTSYSIIKVQLNRDSNHTEIDLLSPEFAEKFACGTECQKLGLYDSNFAKQETQLTQFFFAEEGRFFEFYGRLTLLNDTLADYRASSPAILKKYLALMLNRKLVFNTLSEFLDNLEMHVTEEKLLAFSNSGFISPVENRLSSTFVDDVVAALPNDWQVDDLRMPDDDWLVNDLRMPDDDWLVNDLRMPDDDWLVNDLRMPADDWDSNPLTPDMLLVKIAQDLPTSYARHESWEQAKQNTIQLGSIACTFSDNSFGVVKSLEANKVTLQVIGQARVIVDGMKLYLKPGHLFTATESFYFVKSTLNETYLLSDIATCNIENLKRGLGMKKA
jgi:hypothetical protein